MKYYIEISNKNNLIIELHKSKFLQNINIRVSKGKYDYYYFEN